MAGNQENKRLLFIFDFDQTMVSKNTDGEIIKAQSKIIGSVSAREFYKDQEVGWADSMSYTMQELYKRNITKFSIDEIILQIPLLPGMTNAFDILKKGEGSSYDCIMISHSNKYFIDLLLEKFGLSDVFDRIYTYDCEWVDNNRRLVVKHYDDPWTHCSICPIDFCKGKCIQNHLNAMKCKSVVYNSVVYVGDGSADYCAALQLSENDFVLARKDFYLHKRITNGGDALKAKFLLWESGFDVSDFVRKKLCEI